MNTDKFNYREGKFNLLDLTARLGFKTTSSISFSLERYSESLCPVRQMGWIDVHHPCHGHIKLQIRISLPIEYQAAEKIGAIVDAVLAAVEIPPDETYEALLLAEGKLMAISRHVDREGYTDRL